jgi:hypothetical protein
VSSFIGCKTLGFFSVVAFADAFVNGQLELFDLLEVRSDYLARVTQYFQKKPNLFID